MPIPKGRPRPLSKPSPNRKLTRLARDLLWVAEHGDDKDAKAPSYDAQQLLNLSRKRPIAFWKLYRNVAYDEN